MGAQIAPHFCWIETILETTAENKVLGRILREIKTASPEEIHMFLAEILKISKHWGNPFYGDVGLVSDDLKQSSRQDFARNQNGEPGRNPHVSCRDTKNFKTLG